MNKQEVIEDLKKQLTSDSMIFEGGFERGYDCAIKKAIATITELDEPEKPVVPQFIDTWIQGAKYNGFDLYETMNNWEVPNETDYWIQENPETFAKAWIYGYEIEKEKLYTVELPNPNGDSNRYGLCKVDGRIIIGSFVFGLNKASNAKLTEAEIKKDFDWAWQFAEEVEK